MGLLYLLEIAALLAGVLFGRRLGILAFVLLALVHIVLWVFWRSRPEAGGKKNGLWVGAAVFLSFSLAFVLVSVRPSAFYQMVYQAEGSIYRLFDRLSGQADDTESGGTVSRGNNYRTGEVQLYLTEWDRPTEDLYLKGFVGGEYLGNNWEEADEEADIDLVAARYHWEEWRSWMIWMYEQMYFIMNETSLAEADPEGEQQSRWVMIRNANSSYDTLYIPYYASHQNQWLLYRRNIPANGYGYEYFEQEDMQIDWGLLDFMGEAGTWYRELRDGYEEVVREVYTQVPREQLPRLAALVEENPLEGLDEITSFILYTLSSRASYTLTPGWAPVNEDVVEYFLFESGQGYCQHYAAAAALMYRMYGIPARYVSGYRVEPSAFEQTDNGRWAAEVTDESAHAWVEIFLPEYGWTPVEVTPAADGSMTASFPGYDSSQMDGILAGLDLELPAASGTAGTVQEDQWDGFQLSLDWSVSREVLWVLAACLVYTLRLLPFFFGYRRLRRRDRLMRAGCRAVFVRWIRMLHFGGCLEGWDGTEKDFAEALSGELLGVSPGRIRMVQEIVNAAAFGPSPAAEEEEAAVVSIYFQCAGELEKKMGWIRRLIFRYWKGF